MKRFLFFLKTDIQSVHGRSPGGGIPVTGLIPTGWWHWKNNPLSAEILI
jgi:hypothetical protein